MVGHLSGFIRPSGLFAGPVLGYLYWSRLDHLLTRLHYLRPSHFFIQYNGRRIIDT
jgi:hypothetical protein